MVAIASIFLQSLFDYIVPLVLNHLKLHFSYTEELENIANDLSMIREVLKDAEDQQHRNSAVRHWLSELQHLAYEINDLVDDIDLESQRRDTVPLSGIRNIIGPVNPTRIKFSQGAYYRIKKLNSKLAKIKEQRTSFGLRVFVTENHDHGIIRPTSSLNPLSVLGREYDKERILQFLVSPVSGHQSEAGVGVVAILGMGGLGKTTLAQHVYNDEFVQRHFDLKLWVHVSQNFSLTQVTTAILQSISSYPNGYTLDRLQRDLRQQITGKTYLLVLDDLWTENRQDWNTLTLPLLYGARGSKILVTTRSQEVADSVRATLTYPLQGLSAEWCWSLFRQCAFDGRAYLELGDLKEDILRKCNRLPLSAIALGRRLQEEPQISKWGSILTNERWEFTGEAEDITNAVGLSYQHLPKHLEPCFVYLSLIPKGYVFEKEAVVHWWIAQNFIQPKDGERMEDIGGSYFDSLVKRSFILSSNFSNKFTKPLYTMDPLIHDFAQHVSGEECCILETDKPRTIPVRTRHLTLRYGAFNPNNSMTPSSSHSNTSDSNVFEMIYGAKGLYTLIITGAMPYDMKLPAELIDQFRSLRTLVLSNSSITELPKHIGDLKHLRCLILSETDMKQLPESVGNLYNLQILDLRNCYQLEELPQNMRNLRKLRHLNLHLDSYWISAEGEKLKSMPPEIGSLVHIQTLSRFIVSSRKHCGLRELEKLNDLHGELRISNLQLVPNKDTAELAGVLSRKQNLEWLELHWGGNDNAVPVDAVNTAVSVLECLQPHNSLKELQIVGYIGKYLPKWIGEPSFTNLVKLRLLDCQLERLPQLGRLPLLKDLHVKGMKSVTRVDCDFCGGIFLPFPSLEKLQLESMDTLEEWCGGEHCGIFSLHELIVMDCPNLQKLGHHLPSLQTLHIEGCPTLLRLERGNFPSLHSLKVKGCGEWLWDSICDLSTLTSLTLAEMSSEIFSSVQQGNLPSLRHLEITHCNHLLLLQDNLLPKSLTYFGVKYCPQLAALPDDLQNIKDLEDLEIVHCGQLAYLPESLVNLNSLIRFEISNCPSVRCLPSTGLPKTLQFLSINNCPDLEQRFHHEGGQDWAKIAQIFSVWINKKEIVSNQRPSWNARKGASSICF